MKIVVDKGFQVHRDDLDNLKELMCEVHSPNDHAALSAALQSIGIRLDGDHVWAPVEWLRASDDRSWIAKFDAMIDYAASNGWLEKGCVRAHVEWKP